MADADDDAYDYIFKGERRAGRWGRGGGVHGRLQMTRGGGVGAGEREGAVAVSPAGQVKVRAKESWTIRALSEWIRGEVGICLVWFYRNPTVAFTQRSLLCFLLALLTFLLYGVP